MLPVRHGRARAGLLQRFPRVTLIAFLVVGYDSIVPAEWWARGVAGSNVPAVNYGDVADLAISLMIAAVRGIAVGDRQIYAGNWTGRLGVALPRSIASLRGGIVGLGGGDRHRHCLAADADGCRDHVVRTFRQARYALAAHRKSARPRRSQRRALHRRPRFACQYVLVDAAVLSALGPDGYLINVARGAPVDERALADALRSGGLAGAGLDVFEQKPTPPGAGTESRMSC